ALRTLLTAHSKPLAVDLSRRFAAIDAELTLHEIDSELTAAHELLQPFGAGNPQPLFLARGVEVVSQRTFADGCCELQLRDANGGRATAVVWPSAQPLLS